MAEEIQMDTFDETRPLIDEVFDDDTAFDEASVEYVDESNIPHYRESTPGPSRLTTQKMEVTRQKLAQLYKKLGISSNPEDNPNIDRFRTRYNQKTGASILEFNNDSTWVNLTNTRTGEPLSVASIKTRLGGLVSMKKFLNFEQTPSSLERGLKVSKELEDRTPYDREMASMSGEEILDRVSEIEPLVREMATNTDLDMREMLGLDKALQSIKGELKNNLAKLGELDKHIAREREKLTETDDENMKKRIRNRIKNLGEERQARMEVISNNNKAFSSQTARLRQTIEKLRNSEMTLGEKIKLIFREHGITLAAVTISLGLIIQAIVSAVTGGRVTGGGVPTQPNKIVNWFKRQLTNLANLLGRLAQKAASSLPGIIGSIISGLLTLLKKAVVFAAQHTWAFIVTIVSLVGYLLLDHLAVVERKARLSSRSKPSPHLKK